jgi:hypothetical protein
MPKGMLTPAQQLHKFGTEYQGGLTKMLISTDPYCFTHQVDVVNWKCLILLLKSWATQNFTTIKTSWNTND